MTFIYLKGSTMRELQINRLHIAVRFPRYWFSRGFGFVRILGPEFGL
jgi:hypothetical protein